jgi:PAS domain S-box-containing protein
MDINIRTFAFIIGVTHLIQFVVIYYQYKVNKNYKGIGWWLIWSFIEVLGFLIIVIRGYLYTNSFLIILQNSLIISGTIFVYVGIMSFFGKKANWKTVLTILAAFVLFLSYFTFIDYNLIIRTIVINATLSIISYFTAYNLYKHKLSSVKSSANFLTVVLLIHGIVFTYLTFAITFISGEYEIYSSSSFNIIQYTDAFTVGLLWTFGFIIMINQRLNTENKEEKDELELIFNADPDALLITSLSDGYFARINKGFTRLTGYTQEDINGKTSGDINLWINRKEREILVTELKKNGIIENFEADFRCKDGSKMTGMVSAKIIHLQGVPHILTVTRDINERKRIENELHESEDRLAKAERVAKIGNWKLRVDTKEMISSAGARFIYGVDKDTMSLDDVQKVPLAEYRNILDNALTDLISKDKPYNLEFKIKRINDCEIIDIHSLAEYDKENNIVYGVIHDITDRKAADVEIQRKNEQLQRMNSEKDKFFSIIAHDLRSPFNGFLGLTELMVSDINKMTLVDINRIAGNLHGSAKNLYRLLTNLLEWSKIQRGITDFNPEKLSLKDIIEESSNLFNESARKKSIIISKDISDDYFVLADKSMLDTIIRNLISNGLKFTEQGGNIILSAKETGDMVEVSVKDNGIGMGKDIINNLFKIDKQSTRKGTAGEPSTGLGLLLCKEFIEKNGGQIFLQSEEGKGSEFRITLKRVKEKG